MKAEYCRFISTLLLVGIMAVSMVDAATISFESTENSISPGGSTHFTIVLDSAPDGLSGYNLDVVLSNPDVVDITGVTYPSWASMNNVTYPSTGVVRMSAVDIGATIGPGAGPITLSTITLNGKIVGSTDISITQVNMDTDSGGILTPSLNTSHLNILGSNTVNSGSGSTSSNFYSSGSSSSSGSGGYPSYSSSGSGTPSTVTPTSTKIIESSAIITGVTQNEVTKTVSHESKAVRSGTPMVTNPVQVESTHAEDSAPFPWVIIVEIIIVFGIIGGVIVVYFVRKGL